MTIEVKDNEKIKALKDASLALDAIQHDLIVNHSVDIGAHKNKIERLIDNAIKKERINILNSEIDRIKKGSL